MVKRITLLTLFLLGGGVRTWAGVDFGGNISLDLYYLFQNGYRVAYQVEGKKKPRPNPTNTETALHSPQMFNFLWLQYATEDEALSMYLQVKAGSVLKRYEDNTTNRPDHVFSLFYAWLKWRPAEWLSIKAGRQEQAFSIFHPSQVVGFVDYHGLGANFGDIYGGEGLDGLRMDFTITDNIDLSIMLLDTDTDRSTDNNEVVIIMASGTGDNVREQNLIPRLDIAFPIKTEQFEIQPSATWLRQSFAHNQTGTDDHFDIWGLSLGAKAKFGSLLLGGEVNYGQNLGDGNYIGAGEFFHERNAFGAAGSYTLKGLHISEKTGDTLKQYSKILNTNTLAFWVDLGYEIGSVQPHVLFGTLKIDGEAAPADTNFIKGRRFPKRVAQTMLGINVPILLTEHFSIIPELMYYDWGGGTLTSALFKKHDGFESGIVLPADINNPEAKQNRGEEWIAGLQVRFVF